MIFNIHIAQINPNGQLDNVDELIKKETFYTLTKDGIKLATDIYLPVTQDSLITTLNIGGNYYPVQIIPKNSQYIVYDTNNINKNNFRLPIIFTRTPYNKNGASGTIFPFLGYAHAFQDMRGRYESEGVYFPMYSDGWEKYTYHPNITIPMDLFPTTSASNALHHSDGAEAIFYLNDSVKRIFDYDLNGIPDTFNYSNNYIGMFGASALGNSQYQALSAIPFSSNNNPIKCLMPIVAANEHYNSTLFHNGVFRHILVNGWISGQMMDLDDNLISIDNSLFNNIHTSADYGYTDKYTLTNDMLKWLVEPHFNGLPSGAYPNSPLRVDLDASYANIDQYGFSSASSNISRYKNLNKPIYHLTGWWDIFINGQIETFNQTRNANPGVKNILVIGPWAHQTIGTNKTGDVIYPDNVFDVLGFDFSANYSNLLSDSLLLNKIYSSEILNWYRVHLGGEPYFFIPESHIWQPIGTSTIRIPSKNYFVPYYEFLNYLGGKNGLNNLPIEINNGVIIPLTYNLPVLSNPVINLAYPLTPYNPNYFNNVKDIRFYVTGPTQDNTNLNVGNYWVAVDSFPFNNGVDKLKFYLHQNNTANNNVPTLNEGNLSYLADPNNPVITVGGNNMIPTLPNSTQKSQGSINLANPNYSSYTLNRSDVISFETAPLSDTLLIAGFPRASIYAKCTTTTYNTPVTNFDLMVRILDVYPDGREMFITEGTVNARAREFAKSIYDGNRNNQAPFNNVVQDSFYYYQFEMLPIAHVFGAGHKIKFLISSSNFPKYQSNPHIPLNTNEFFKWQPGDTSGYNFNNNYLYAQPAQITLNFNPQYPSFIEFPKVVQFNSGTNNNKTNLTQNDVEIYPNPSHQFLTLNYNLNNDTKVKVFDITGKEVLSFDLLKSQNTIIVETLNLKSGLYLLIGLNENGQKVFSKKFIKN